MYDHTVLKQYGAGPYCFLTVWCRGGKGIIMREGERYVDLGCLMTLVSGRGRERERDRRVGGCICSITPGFRKYIRCHV